MAQLGCDVAQLEKRRLAVRQARVRIPARHPREAPATELQGDDEKRTQSFSKCRCMNEYMNECTSVKKIIKIKKKNLKKKVNLHIHLGR